MEDDDHFHAVERIKADAAVAEQIGVIGDVLRLEVFERKIFHQQLFQFCFHVIQ
ncbi:hypothetical protein BH10PLA1_BH10PLA1_09240 [soil metagenome]